MESLHCIQRLHRFLLVLLYLLYVSHDSCTHAYNYTYRLREEDSTPRYLGNLVMDLSLHRLLPPAELESRVIAFFPSNQAGEEYFDVVKLSARSQQLRLKKRLNREEVCSAVRNELSLCQCESTSPENGCYLLINFAMMPISAQFIYFSIRVNISDINDNEPIFEPSTFLTTFSESDPIGTERQIPVAKDSDMGENGLITYRLESNRNLFSLNWTKNTPTLKLILKGALDREVLDSYKIYVIAQDSGTTVNTGQLIVTVEVTDVNDQIPVFQKEIYNVEVAESSPIGSFVAQVQATDKDILKNGLISYLLDPSLKETMDSIFSLDDSTGTVSLKSSLDRESIDNYKLIIHAVDHGSPRKSSSTLLIVKVNDVNDNIPNIQISPEASVRENRPINTVITTFTVSDEDFKENGTTSCQVYDGDLASDHSSNVLFFDSLKASYRFGLSLLAPDVVNTYKLETKVVFDRELISSVNVTVICKDNGTPVLYGSKTVHLTIVDENDQIPRFLTSTYSIRINENNSIGLYLLTVTALDEDSGLNAKITYFIIDKSLTSFHVDSQTGVFRAIESLDRESKEQYQVLIGARDNGSPSITATATIIIYVLDVNDVPPKIKISGPLAVKEHESAGAIVGTISTFDPDLGSGSETAIYLSETNDFDLRSDGTLITKRSFDREIKETIQVTVYAKDKGTPSLTSSEEITVVIHDINDWAPEFIFPNQDLTSLNISFREQPGFLIVQLSARDRDSGMNGQISYILDPESSLFKLDKATGSLITRREYSLEDLGRYSLTYVARDNGSPTPLQVSKHLVIYLTDSPPKWLLSGSLAGKLDNFSIMVIIACVSGVLICALVVAIVAVVRKRHGSCKGICGGSGHALKANSYSSSSTEINPGANLNRITTPKKTDQDFNTSPSHIPLRIQEETILNNSGTQQYFEMSSIGSAPGSNSDSGKGASTESNAGSTQMNNSTAIVACSQPPGACYVTSGVSAVSCMNVPPVPAHSMVATTCFGVIPKGGVNSKLRRPAGHLSPSDKQLSSSLTFTPNRRLSDDNTFQSSRPQHSTLSHSFNQSKTETLTNSFYSPRREGGQLDFQNHNMDHYNISTSHNSKHLADQNDCGVANMSPSHYPAYSPTLASNMPSQNSLKYSHPRQGFKISFQSPALDDSASHSPGRMAYSPGFKHQNSSPHSDSSPRDCKDQRLLKLLDMTSRTSIV